MTKTMAFGWLLFFSVVARGAEPDTLWIHMNVNHSYRDATGDCRSIKPGGDLYFVAKHQNGKLLRVTLSNFPYVFPYTYIYKSIVLSSEEVAQIKMYKDATGRLWVKSFPLSDPLIKWILYYAPENFSYCPLPQPIKTITPSAVLYDFETDGIDEGILISYTETQAFTGTRSDGLAFTAKMQIMQRPYKPEIPIFD